MENRRPDPESRTEAVRRGDSCGFARLLGMEVTRVADGCVRVAMQAKGMENAYGTVHGGAIFALADHAFGIAANLDGVGQVAISAHVHYLSPPVAGMPLEAVAKRVGDGEDVCVCGGRLYGRSHVASFEGIGFKIGFVE